jgi:hypothetical protein
MDLKSLEPRDVFVIHERLKQSPLSVPVPGNLPIEPQLNKLVREVYQIKAEIGDLTFDGKPLDHQPGWYEVLLEAIKPGKQFRGTPTGVNHIFAVYAGYFNLVNLPFLPGSPSFSGRLLAPPFGLFTGKWYSVYGTDPIPKVQLYANVKVAFTSVGGTGDPAALAFYNGYSGELRDIGVAHRSALFKELRSNPLLNHVTF